MHSSIHSSTSAPNGGVGSTSRPGRCSHLEMIPFRHRCQQIIADPDRSVVCSCTAWQHGINGV